MLAYQSIIDYCLLYFGFFGFVNIPFENLNDIYYQLKDHKTTKILAQTTLNSKKKKSSGREYDAFVCIQ